MSNSQQDGVKRELPTVLTNRLAGAILVSIGMALGFGFANIQQVGPIPPSSVLKEYGSAKVFDVLTKESPAISELNMRRASELMSDADWELNIAPMKVIARLEFANGKAVQLDLGRQAFSIDGVQGFYRIAKQHEVEYGQWIEKEVLPLVLSARK